jgi:hypothetical protein
MIDIRLKRNLVEVPRENSISSSEGEKIQKRVYIISGKFLTFILKVPIFVWFCDDHLGLGLGLPERFPTKIWKSPKSNLLSTYQFAGPDACHKSTSSQGRPQDNFGWTELQAAK